MAKKLLSVLLVLCMILSYAPMATYAAMPNDREIETELDVNAAGTRTDPHILEEGRNEFELAKAYSIYFQFTAPSNGTLTVEVNTSTGHWYFNAASSTLWDKQPGAKEMSQGDKYLINFRIYNDSSDKYGGAAGTATFNVVFTASGAACEHPTTEVRDAVEATCTEAGYTGDTYCTACDVKTVTGQTITALGHDYSEETGICSRCPAVDPDFCIHETTEVRDVVAKGCTKDGYTGNTYCTNCGKKLADGEAIPAGHTKEVVPAREPSCTVDGNSEYERCIVCRAMWGKTTIASRGYHDAAEPVYENANEITHEKVIYCVDCHYEMERTITCIGEHSYVEGICEHCKAVQPTCTHENTEVRNVREATCSTAGYTGDTFCLDCEKTIANGNATARLPHTEVVIDGRAPTCTQAGATEGKKCEVCNAIITPPSPIAATGHNFVKGVCTVCGVEDPDYVEPECQHTNTTTAETVTVKPSCTVAGSKTVTVTCDDCDEVVSTTEVEIAALGHTEEPIPAVEPTYTTVGYTAGVKCSVCGITLEEPQEIPAKDPLLPEAEVVVLKDKGVMNLTDADADLTFALNFQIKDIENFTEDYIQALFEKYGDYYVDFVLTINKDVVFDANGTGNGYLAGQYSAWSENWVVVPFNPVTIEANQPVKIMKLAAEMLNQSGLRMTLIEIAAVVQSFNCGVYFTPEFLAANPDLEVSLSLQVFENDEAEHAVLAIKNFDVNYAAAVSAEGKQTRYFDSFAAAFAAAEAGETVELLRDVTLSNTLVINKAITLDGNGKTLTYTGSGSTARAINISGASGVTIKNLTIDAAKAERAINIIQNATNVTIENVTATADNYTVNVAASAPNAVVIIKGSTLNGKCTVNVTAAGADITVNNTVINCNDDNTTAGESYAALSLGYEAAGAKIITNGCTIYVTEDSDSLVAKLVAPEGQILIDGSAENVAVMVAIITYPGPYYHAFSTLEKAIEFAKADDTITMVRDVTISSTLVINKAITLDGNGKTLTYTGSGSSARAINVREANGVTIKNLTIDAAKAERAINIIQNATNVTIENVTATAANYTVNVAASAPNAVVTIKNCELTGLNVVNVGAPGAKITIEGGKITCNDQKDAEKYAALFLNKDATNATITAAGVTFDIKGDSGIASNYANGGTITINGSGDGVSVGVAYISYGDYGYGFKSLADAIAFAKDGETIILLADVTLTERLSIRKQVNIDLNGYTISGEFEDSYGMIYVATAGNLTITGEGKITNTAGMAIGNYGILTVENGTISGKDASIYNFYYNANTYGKTTIDGGKVEGWIWNCGVLTVNAGEISKIDNSGALVVTGGDVAYILAKNGSDAPEVPGSGTITIADSSVIEVEEGKHIIDEGEGVYSVCDGATSEQIKNNVAADCTSDGSYEKVVYCQCGKELSRETVTVPALGHTAGETVVENKVDANCATAGSYDNVVYCSVCDEELSRETVTIPALGHTAGETVVENKVDANCTTAGSYDNVVYCSVCDEELSRKTITVPALGHTDDNNDNICDNGNHVMTGIIDGYYYVDGEIEAGAGLIKVDEYFYFVGSRGQIVVNRTKWISGDNAFGFAAGNYEFDENGHMVIFTDIIDDYYYENGTIAKSAGLVKVGDFYYFVDGQGKIIKNRTKWISGDNEFGFAAGNYEFDEDGHMVMFTGIDGDYYYENGLVAKGKGLVKIGNDLYFVDQSGKILKSTTKWLSANVDFSLAKGRYLFGKDGKMIRTAGLVKVGEDYYYLKANGVVYTGSKYVSSNDLGLAAGRYTFGDDGKLIMP